MATEYVAFLGLRREIRDQVCAVGGGEARGNKPTRVAVDHFDS
jgi:hypothetical protein